MCAILFTKQARSYYDCHNIMLLSEVAVITHIDYTFLTLWVMLIIIIIPLLKGGKQTHQMTHIFIKRAHGIHSDAFRVKQDKPLL